MSEPRIHTDDFVVECETAGVDARSRYSGRGMNGRDCPAITGDMSALVAFCLDVLPELYPDGNMPRAWRNVATDTMGTELVFYWPGIRVDADSTLIV